MVKIARTIPIVRRTHFSEGRNSGWSCPMEWSAGTAFCSGPTSPGIGMDVFAIATNAFHLSSIQRSPGGELGLKEQSTRLKTALKTRRGNWVADRKRPSEAARTSASAPSMHICILRDIALKSFNAHEVWICAILPIHFFLFVQVPNWGVPKSRAFRWYNSIYNSTSNSAPYTNSTSSSKSNSTSYKSNYNIGSNYSSNDWSVDAPRGQDLRWCWD